ncbi:MAG: YicC/YloC family endoribonuclease [candidate division Zixibacteria bacterium]
MAYSMTGFGRAATETGNNKITVEINTVNNRFLDYQIRLPRTIAPLEQNIKTLLNGIFNRGKISISISWEQVQGADVLVLDEEKTESYMKIYELLKGKYGLSDKPAFRDFVALPDLVKSSKEEDDLDSIWNDLKTAISEAAEAVVKMRLAEGENLVADLLSRSKQINSVTSQIEELAPANVVAYKEKLQARINELMGQTPVDEQRIAMEISIFSEKSDITEECTRLKSHLSQLESSLKENKPIGKRLNFILQELNREINTIGSKSSDYEISSRVISVKEEIERLREQVQNIE